MTSAILQANLNPKRAASFAENFLGLFTSRLLPAAPTNPLALVPTKDFPRADPLIALATG